MEEEAEEAEGLLPSLLSLLPLFRGSSAAARSLAATSDLNTTTPLACSLEAGRVRREVRAGFREWRGSGATSASGRGGAGRRTVGEENALPPPPPPRSAASPAGAAPRRRRVPPARGRRRSPIPAARVRQVVAMATPREAKAARAAEGASQVEVRGGRERSEGGCSVIPPSPAARARSVSIPAARLQTLPARRSPPRPGRTSAAAAPPGRPPAPRRPGARRPNGRPRRGSRA